MIVGLSCAPDLQYQRRRSERAEGYEPVSHVMIMDVTYRALGPDALDYETNSVGKSHRVVRSVGFSTISSAGQINVV